MIYNLLKEPIFVQLTNEFKFPVASFHHAASAYLVPDLLKSVYGGAPAVALFASNARYFFFLIWRTLHPLIHV